MKIAEWIESMRVETDSAVKRRERFLFDLATFIMTRAKFHAKKNFGRGIGKTARTKGRSGALMRSIEIERVSNSHFIVTAGGAGVPYASVHEYGATIRPKPPRQFLTVPLMPQYVGRRAGEFDDLFYVKPRDSKYSFLMNSDDKMAYLLLREVKIPARPYLKPAAEDAANNDKIMERLKLIYGNSKLPFKVTRI